jgi:hypothetical protein
MADKNILQIDINVFEAQGLLGVLRDNLSIGSSKMSLATASAINRALAHMRTLVIRDIRATYNVRRADVTTAMKLKEATAKKIMRGSLEFQGRAALPLISFGGRQNKRGVSVRVLKTSKAANIRPGGTHNILATKKKGRAAVWIAKGAIMARTEDADHPVMLWGPSFLAYFHRPGVAEQLRDQAEAKFRERLAHEVSRISKGIGLTGYKGRR